MTSRPLPAVAAALIVGCLTTAQASADTVNLTFDKTTGTSSVSVNVNGTSITCTPGPYYWHESNPPSGSLFPNPTTTFCVELTQKISTGNTYSYTSTPLAATSGVTAGEANAISQLWGAHYNTAWSSSSFGGSDQSTAFQLALWELVNDYGSNLNLSSGNFKVTAASSNAVSLAQSWLNGLSSLPANEFATNFANSQLVWLSNSYNQDQLTMIPKPTGPPTPGVPAPPGVILAAIGAVCLAGRSIRRKVA